MPEATDPASVVNQLGQQGQEMLEKSQTMVADLLRGYLGQFQVGCCCCMDPHIYWHQDGGMRLVQA